MITGIKAKATIVTTIFKPIFFCHNFVAIDDANTTNRDFISLFHSRPPSMLYSKILVEI